MSVKIDIPLYLQPFTNSNEAVEVGGSTVGGCLKQLVTQFPDIEKMLFAKNGELLGYTGVYLNGQDTYPEGLAKAVKDGDELFVLYLIGGG